MIVFTIAARNFIPYAAALHDSVLRHHPDTTFVLALADIDAGYDRDALPFEILTLATLRDVRVWGMAERYTATEFCTSIKPLVFQVLMDRHPGAAILYLDPDIMIVSRLIELERLLDAGAQAVMTPHIEQPGHRPRNLPDQALLRAGTYNLGFLALREGADTRALMAWWADKLEYDCRIDLAQGLFVDQKWGDLFPALLDRVAVLRHPGYNLAYWNMPGRQLRAGPLGWTVNGQPLRFVHFSGHDLATPDLFSRHAPFFERAVVGDLFLLQAAYREAVLAAGFGTYGRLRYGFRYGGEGGQGNPHAVIEVADQIRAGTPSIGQPLPPWDSVAVTTVASWAEWEAQRPGLAPVFAGHRATERTLLPPADTGFTLPARCGMCRTDAALAVDFSLAVQSGPDDRVLPDWREHLTCRCGFTGRIRGAMHAFETLIAPPPVAALYVTEQASNLPVWLQQRWPATVGSENLGPGHVPGEVYDGIRHEDLSCLSFESNQFDAVLSFDGLARVPNVRAALGECWRVLKPGGTLLFAAPTQFDTAATIDGALPGHAHPGQQAGAHFGLAVLDVLRGLGFEAARCALFWSRELGLLGEDQSVFLARKPADAPVSRRPAVPVPAAGRVLPAPVPDAWAYGQHDPGRPILQAYHLDRDITAVMDRLALYGSLSLVDRFRMLVLLRLLRSTAAVMGEVWELGVYRGGTALVIRNELAAAATTTLRLFDTFAGLPSTDPVRDVHVQGEFADTSLAEVQALVGTDAFIDWRPGLVPDTFDGLDSVTLRFVHVDLDLYAPIRATVEFVWARMAPGGIVLFDDYGFVSCPGARMAVDEFCTAQGLALIPLPTGQSLLIKTKV